MTDTSRTADAVTDLARLALAFGRIERTACWHPDGLKREDDADHTVMLGWIAPALADLWYPDALDAGLVAQFALIHDMTEVYAGDTPTLRISAEGREAKAGRERAAERRIRKEFLGRLSWVARILRRYEEQVEPEARFVRAVDKLLPKIVHILDGHKGLDEQGVTAAELRQIIDRQTADMDPWAGEFSELAKLRAVIADRAVALLEATETAA